MSRPNKSQLKKMKSKRMRVPRNNNHHNNRSNRRRANLKLLKKRPTSRNQLKSKRRRVERIIRVNQNQLIKR